MSINISPDELLTELLKDASSRRKRSLEIVYNVCKEQTKRGSKDFSPVTIGHLSQEAGGPKERTIRNEDGKDYRAIMNVWASYTNGVTKKPRSEKEPSVTDEILAGITDPTIRALVGVVMAENRKLKGENSLLKRSTILTLDMRPDARPVLNNEECVEIFSPAYNLVPSEIEALKHAISKDLLDDQCWTPDDQGRIKHKGRPVFKVGFVTGIKKVLESIEKSNL
jgi:hypothetical protein